MKKRFLDLKRKKKKKDLPLKRGIMRETDTQGGCGQDPWTSHSMSAPDVDTTTNSDSCYVSNCL